MRALILGDVHHRTDLVDNVVRWAGADAVVLLGDYLTNWDDSPADVTKTARWLKERLHDPKVSVLLGNHDLGYLHGEFEGDVPYMDLPGWTREKARAAAEVLAPEDWAKARLFKRCGPWLLSHAGLCPELVYVIGDRPLVDSEEEAIAAAKLGEEHPLLACGPEHQGPDPVSGPLWLRWDKLKPTPGLHQIVGHTFDQRPRGIMGASANLCIDCAGRAFALVDDERGVTEIYSMNGSPRQVHEIAHAQLAQMAPDAPAKHGFFAPEPAE